MTMLRELAGELIGMFLGNRRLALALLAVIGAAALASEVDEAGPSSPGLFWPSGVRCC
jgi:hypothetical protein